MTTETSEDDWATRTATVRECGLGFAAWIERHEAALTPYLRRDTVKPRPAHPEVRIVCQNGLPTVTNTLAGVRCDMFVALDFVPGSAALIAALQLQADFVHVRVCGTWFAQEIIAALKDADQERAALAYAATPIRHRSRVIGDVLPHLDVDAAQRNAWVFGLFCTIAHALNAYGIVKPHIEAWFKATPALPRFMYQDATLDTEAARTLTKMGLDWWATNTEAHAPSLSSSESSDSSKDSVHTSAAVCSDNS